MTFKSLKAETKKNVCRSSIQPRDNSLASNLYIDPATTPLRVKYRKQTFADDSTASATHCALLQDNGCQAEPPIPVIDTPDLVRRSFFISTPEDNQCLRAKIIKTLDFTGMI